MKILLLLFAFSASSSAPADGWPLFAMDTGTRDADHATPAAQAALLEELGYDGIGWTGYKDLPQLLPALDARRLKLLTIYTSAAVEPDGFTYEPGLKEALPLLKGRNVVLWVPIASKRYAASSPDGDGQAVAMLREMADMAKPYQVKIALYPHTASWLEKIEDAVRVADKVDRPDVGVTFNLCHWLNAGKGQNLNPLLELARPRLMLVTVNGADAGGTDWPALIQPLGQGTYDVKGFLDAVIAVGYRGPIGLQHYGIAPPVKPKLRQSMEAWKTLTATGRK